MSVFSILAVTVSYFGLPPVALGRIVDEDSDAFSCSTSEAFTFSPLRLSPLRTLSWAGLTANGFRVAVTPPDELLPPATVPRFCVMSASVFVISNDPCITGKLSMSMSDSPSACWVCCWGCRGWGLFSPGLVEGTVAVVSFGVNLWMVFSITPDFFAGGP